VAFYDNTWYVNSVGYAAVTARPQNTAVAAGVIRKQFTAPAVNSERCFVCIVAGTTANTTDATWTTTRGAKTTDGTATWCEITGVPAMNGDATNTPTWATAKATAVPSVGAVIKRNNGASYQICTTAGTMGASEPAFSDTAGVTTNDGTSVWTSLGVVGNFSAGGAPNARLGGAYALISAGAPSTWYIGDNHAETQSSAMNITWPASVSKTLCHNHSGSYPPAASDLTTGATVTTTGNSTITMTAGSGQPYVYGVSFRAGSGASGTASINFGSGGGLILDNCDLQLLSTGASSRLFPGASGVSNFALLNNTPVKFSAAGQCFDYGAPGHFVWQNTSPGIMAGSTAPTFLINWNSLFSTTKFTIEAVDLSAVSSSIVNYANPIVNDTTFKDCKLNASWTPTTSSRTANTTQFIRSDSGATAYKSSRHTAEAFETTETSITRVGGAQDPSGQAQSRKIVTTVNPTWQLPYKAESLAIWNPTTGANVTVTVYGTVNDAVLPRNDDIWLDVLYLGSSSSPLGSVATTTKASILAANAAVASDSSSWNGGGSGAGWSPFKLVATLSSPQPGLAGFLEARVRVAKVSSTYYIDPRPVLS
jgi:hypothetical protein